CTRGRIYGYDGGYAMDYW
nr:immunoglobulin heavy chain junction region [Mus musculus]